MTQAPRPRPLRFGTALRPKSPAMSLLPFAGRRLRLLPIEESVSSNKWEKPQRPTLGTVLKKQRVFRAAWQTKSLTLPPFENSQACLHTGRGAGAQHQNTLSRIERCRVISNTSR